MRKIKKTRIAAMKLFNEVANAKEEPAKSELIRLSGAIEKSYRKCSRFYQQLWKYEPISGFTDAEKDTLRSSYYNQTSPLKFAKNKIRKALGDNKHCPYCHINLAEIEIDHFLPDSRFPELSIFPNNLVPACGDCNFRKLSKSHILNDDQFLDYNYFFNPYLNEVPSEQFLFCTITGRTTFSADFHLECPADFDGREFETLFSHFTTMELDRIYKSESKGFINEELKHGLSLRDKHGLSLQSFFEGKLETLTDEFGVNHFKTVIIEEIVSSGLIRQL